MPQNNHLFLHPPQKEKHKKNRRKKPQNRQKKRILSPPAFESSLSLSFCCNSGKSQPGVTPNLICDISSTGQCGWVRQNFIRGGIAYSVNFNYDSENVAEADVSVDSCTFRHNTTSILLLLAITNR